jgi:hypothetical protein
MAKVIICAHDFSTEQVSTHDWVVPFLAQIIDEEDIKTYLTYMASTEGYSSVGAYLEHNPLYQYPVDGSRRVLIQG